MRQQSVSKALSLTGTAAAVTLASIPQVNAKPIEAAQGSAEDLGVTRINLKGVVKCLALPTKGRRTLSGGISYPTAITKIVPRKSTTRK